MYRRRIDRVPVQALAQTGDTPLGRAFAGLPRADNAQCAVLPLDQGRDAFVIRALLADAATRCLDVQYYIWRNDRTGRLLLERLWEAAERGVRVRLLLDDNNTTGMDELLARVAAHPNIAVRLFNPFRFRRFRVLDFLFDFSRANRRMHNKAFIADGQAAVLGGRNVGDEYFEGGGETAFADMDVLVAGRVLPEVSASFDAYWNCEAAYDASLLLPPAPADAQAGLRRDFDALHQEPQTRDYLAAVRDSSVLNDLNAGRLPVEWTSTQLVADPPGKILVRGDQEPMLDHLARAVGHTERALDLVSAYFVPTRSGTAALVSLRSRGVRVRVLTNSLAATDVPAVHAGYARWRRRLLRAGVKLFELKPDAGMPAPRRARQRHRAGSGLALGSGSGLAIGRGSSTASLHAKTFGIDGERIYVGSFNLDPRSARLNTELGLVIHSQAMARGLAEAFDHSIPERAYELKSNPSGPGLLWLEKSPQGELRHEVEPRTSLWRRLAVQLLALLPIEGLL